MSEHWPSPVATATTAVRLLYAELVTVVLTSLLVALASLPLVTVGPAILAGVEVLTTVVTRRDTGAPPTERGRFRLFVDAVRRNLGAGLPFSLLLLSVGGLTTFYYVVGTTRGDGGLLLLALLGAYGVVGAFALTLRAGSFRARTSPPPSVFSAVRMAGQSFTEHLSYTVLWFVALAGLLGVASAVPVTIVVLLPGVLAVLEVVAFEAVVGDGAAAVAPDADVE